MKMDLISVQEYNQLVAKLNDIEKKIDTLTADDGINGQQISTITDTCRILQISPRTLQRYRDEGKIGFTQVGSKILFSAQQIQAFLAAHTIEPYKTRNRGK